MTNYINKSDKSMIAIESDGMVTINPTGISIPVSNFIKSAWDEQTDEPEFKVGDWIYIINDGCNIYGTKEGDIAMIDSIEEDEPSKITLSTNAKIGIARRVDFENGYNKSLESREGDDRYIRHATPTEIAAVKPKEERKVLHTTHDGIPLYEGDTYWFCYKSGFNNVGRIDTPDTNVINHSTSIKSDKVRFSTESACQAYLDSIHKPKQVKSWSLEQLLELGQSYGDYLRDKTDVEDYLFIKKSDLI